jgi:DNA-binding HxlR family transcriptional regulator
MPYIIFTFKIGSMEKKEKFAMPECREQLVAIKDVMELLSGKWKLQIVGSLLFGGKMRFMDLRRAVDGIAAKMLSKELQELEQNELITRKELHTKPITVEYELTPHGKTLGPLIFTISSWGVSHRKWLFRKKKVTEKA